MPAGSKVRRATRFPHSAHAACSKIYVDAKQRVGEDIFAPEWTDYDKRIHYRTYDVTSQLASRISGKNVDRRRTW